MLKKNFLQFAVDKNAVNDDGEGKITFKTPLIITDNTEQRNGTQYDIKSMDLSEYDGVLTANHGWNIDDIIGKTFGLRKVANKKVVIDGIQFAIKENPYARFAYNMLVNGYATDFSIETYGPWPDDEGIYHEAKLVGLSMVVTGNNKSARMRNEYQQVVLNSINQSKEDGLDTSVLEEKLGIDKGEVIADNSGMFVTIKNGKKFAIKVTHKNAAGDEVETTVNPGETIDVEETQAKDVQGQIDDAQEPETPEEEEDEDEEEEEEGEAENKIEKAVKNATAPLLKKINNLEERIFDNSAEEPQFRPAGKGEGTKFAQMGYKERHAKQIQYAWDALKKNDFDASKKLAEINKINLEALQKEDIVDNSVTISDFGNFIISPELLRDIEGTRSDFSALLARFGFQETLSTQFAYLKRSGDINMQEVEMCDDDEDGNLKPISEYSATMQTANLHELAAVTPVCNAATRFLAVDLLGDVAQGYRTDYDRKRAQLIIARLQQAVNTSGNKIAYNLDSSSTLNPLNAMVDAASRIAESIDSGVWIFNTKSYWELMRRRMAAGQNQDSAFPLFTTGENGPLFLGSPYIVVPNELMPSLNTAETKSFTVEGATVTINQGMFYVDPSTWTGRTSGGLQYDLSTEAAYEIEGEVRSAYQRNELVLRGSFFRGGAIRNTDKVASLSAAGVS